MVMLNLGFNVKFKRLCWINYILRMMLDFKVMLYIEGYVEFIY